MSWKQKFIAVKFGKFLSQQTMITLETVTSSYVTPGENRYAYIDSNITGYD